MLEWLGWRSCTAGWAATVNRAVNMFLTAITGHPGRLDLFDTFESLHEHDTSS